MIRILVVDDHPTVRAGLEAVIRIEPGLVTVGSCASLHEALAAGARTSPSVAVVDYDLGDGDGLELCMLLRPLGIRTLIYSAYSERALGPASVLAGARGLLNKSVGGDELCDAIRSVARDIPRFPHIDRETVDSCASRLDAEDVPVLGLMLKGHSRRDAEDVLLLGDGELDARLERMVHRLKPPIGLLQRT